MNSECLHRYVLCAGDGLLYVCECGAFGDAEDFQIDAPRSELADLEREIGRAVIGRAISNNAAFVADQTLDGGRLLFDISDTFSNEIWAAIARWRELHAEGAEAEAATERQEEK